MAHSTINIPASAPATHGLLAMVARIPAAFGGALVRMAESSSQMRQIKALQALSDAELKEYGIRREDIAHHVFSGSYWI